jgi:chromosome segregation ATPase
MNEFQLSEEIQALENQVTELQHYLISLRSHLTPAVTSTEVITTKELIEQAKVVAARTQEIAVKEAEVTAIESSLEALRSQLKGKRDDLRKAQQQQGFEVLKKQAEELNEAVDRVIGLLGEMRLLNQSIRTNDFLPMSIDIDESALPYCDVLATTIRVHPRPSVVQAWAVRAKNNKTTT